MSDLRKQLKKQLTHAFLLALRNGSREPINQLRDELKAKIVEYTQQPPKSSLEEVLASPAPDMRDAKDLLALKEKAPKPQLRASLNEHPDRKAIVSTLKQARKTAKNLNIGYRGYTIKDNAKYIGAITAFSTGLFTLIPLVTAFNTASIETYGAFALLGLFLGGLRGATANTSEYFEASNTGLKYIRKSMKLS